MNFTFSSSNDSIRFILDDDGPGSVKLLRPDGLTTLASGLSDTNHKIEILKETSLGRITFNGLELDDGKSLNSPPARPPRKIEYYGDSIQVGLSLESERNDEDEALRGVYYNYTGITSRMFDAEFTNMSRSGATISQCHASYDRIDWNTSTPLWDFNNFQPDLVVVGIGANDLGPVRKKKADYHDFLDDLRATHPNAHIMLYNGYGWSVANEPAGFTHEVIAERGDPDMSSAIYPWLFEQGHPCETDHSGIAMYLAEHIEATLGWTPVAPQDVFSGFGVGGDVANGSFEEVAPFGGWGWRYFDDPGVSRVYDPSGAYDGDYYLRLSDGAESQQSNPCDSGEMVTLTAWMAGANNGDQVTMTIEFRDGNDGGRALEPPVVLYSDTKTLTTDWVEYSFSATAPSPADPIVATRVHFIAGAGDTVDIDYVSQTTGSGGSYCDDGTCDPGEDQCNCPEDCGTPPSTETDCTDGIDEDCDTYTDCDDSDCDTDPACIDPYCGDETCDPGEDQCNCPDDCGTPPSTETSCTDGIDNDCDLDTDCDDIDCDGDPACPDCGLPGDPCTTGADCCSGRCNTGLGQCK